MFPRRANEWETKQMFCFLAAQTKKQTGKHLLRTQNVSEKIQKHFCVSDANFASATNVACARKPGNICVRNNVSSFAGALNGLHMTNAMTKVVYVFRQTRLTGPTWQASRRIICSLLQHTSQGEPHTVEKTKLLWCSSAIIIFVSIRTVVVYYKHSNRNDDQAGQSSEPDEAVKRIHELKQVNCSTGWCLLK